MKTVFNDTVVITYFDLKRLFLRHFSMIKLSAILCGLVVGAFLLLREPVYHAEATFKQAGKHNDISMNMKEMFQQILPMPLEGGTMAIMQSNEVLRDVTERMGLQVRCNADFFLVRGFKRIWENISCELAHPLSDPDAFAFSNVLYSGEQPLRLFIKLKGERNFELFNGQKKLIGEGMVDQPMRLQNVDFTLKHVPKNVKLDRFYGFTIEPWIDAVAKLKKRFDVRPIKTDKSILQLAYLSRDRHFASAVLNQVMQSYQKYLKRENEEICQIQLAYLQGRRQELVDEFDQALAEHVDYLKQDLGNDGFMGFAQELETLSEPKNLYTSKLFNVDVELGRALTGIETQLGEQKKINSKKASRTKTFLLDKIKKEKNNQLEEFDLEQKQLDAFPVQPLVAEIEQVNVQINEGKLLLECVEKGEEIPAKLSLACDPKSVVADLIKQILDSKNTIEKLESNHENLGKTQLISYLRAAIEQLELKHKILNENLNFQQEELSDFRGLSLETAQKLMVDYTHQYDTVQAQMKELIYLRDRLFRPDFELSSLGVAISDPITNELIQKASAAALQLQDSNNRSVREQERLLESLKTQKKFLTQYIFQTVDLKKLRLQLLEDKIASLHQQIVNLLQSEKELLGQKIKEINVKMGDLPEKWRRESLLMLKKEIGSMMIQAVSQLAETKFLGQNTFQVASKPLDLALPPTKPKSPKIFFLSLLAAVIGGAMCYFLLLCRALLSGLPVSHETLKLLGFPFFGSLSCYGDTSLSQMRENDLETLRRTSEFLSSHLKQGESMTAVCIGGKYPNYSKGLAEMLFMRGLKVLVIQYVFDQVVHPEQVPGLWHYFNGQIKDLPIREQLSYDYLPSGGTTRHGAEFVSSRQFLNLLNSVKEKYDVILLFTNADAAKAEGLAYLKIADATMITVQQEKKEELAVYCDWSQKKGTDCTAFIYAEERRTMYL